MEQFKLYLKGKLSNFSIIIGIISIIGTWGWIFFPHSWIEYLLGNTEKATIYGFLFTSTSLIGLIVGILSLKSKNKLGAIIGIVLCLIGLLLSGIFLVYVRLFQFQ